jgi:hypothetical protein
MLLCLKVSRNLGQDPVFNFGGDGMGPNVNSTMILMEGSRK